MQAQKPVDIDGSEAVSTAILELLNTFPGLSERQRVQFSTVGETSGIGFYPTSGAVIEGEKVNICGHVRQVCLYPFSIVYRAAPHSEDQRLHIKEFLDALGRWLERQPIVIHGETVQLGDYPALRSGNRVIKVIGRTSPAYLDMTYPDGIEDWVISAQLKYENEFDR